MKQVRISTPRGLSLFGTLQVPPGLGANPAPAVVFSHGFLSEHTCSGVFNQLSSDFVAAGYATLLFDYSGCGESDDAVISLAGQVEDLKSACAWMSQQGFDQQAIFAGGYGSRVAFAASPPSALTMIHVGALTGPLTYRWDEVFSSEQLDSLEETGILRVPDDSFTSRQEMLVSRETLKDYSLSDPAQLLGQQKVPHLLLHGQEDDEFNGLIELSRAAMTYLPASSRLEVIAGGDNLLSNRLPQTAELSLQWLQSWLPAPARAR